MMIVNKCFGVKVENNMVQIYHGDKVVEHRKIKKSETEQEVALELLSHFKENALYNRWLKIDQLVEDTQLPLYKLKTNANHARYLRSTWVKYINSLEERLQNMSLTEMW